MILQKCEISVTSLHSFAPIGRSAVTVATRRHRVAVDRLQRHNQVIIDLFWSSFIVVRQATTTNSVIQVDPDEPAPDQSKIDFTRCPYFYHHYEIVYFLSVFSTTSASYACKCKH